jgi:SPP1 gp7 family putative phage head morphogenesis protein
MMKNNKYWQKRIVMLEEAQLKKGHDFYNDLEKQYRIAIANVQRQIESWYQRFADNNEISLVEAKKLLSTKELAEFKWDVETYIKYGRENALNQQWMKELENASARFHVSRLEALKLQIQQQIEVLYGNQLDGLDKLARNIYSEGYYHTAYEIQKGFNIGWDLQPINEQQLSAVISKPWTADGQTFKDRCWTNKQQLINSVHTQLTQCIIRGDSPDNAIKTIAEQFNVSKNKAGRLIMTESAFFASQAQKDCFKALDVEKYEIVATLDNRTSQICQDLDGEVFDMKDYQVGVTAPPFHPWCRTTTVPYFEDNYGERAARDEKTGKTYYVPSNMKYKDWKKAFVDGGSKTGLKEILPIDTIIKNVFVAAKDLKEAEAFATDMLGSKVNYKGMDLDTANRLNEGMFKTLNEFPQLKGFIDEFKVSKAKSFYGQFSAEMIRLAPDQVKIKRTLKFSNMGHKENILEKLLASIEKDVKKNFHFKGITPQHIAAHELAHALEHQIVFNRLNKDVLSISEWNNFARTLNTSKEAKSITDAALKNMGIAPIGREAYEAYKDLGRYALKSRSELMAQAVADALISDEPLQFSLEVLKEVKKRLGGVN